MKHLPNILSGWRLLSFPLLLFFIFSAKRDAFTVLLSVNLITDVLDGFLARRFKWQTEFGAKLDSAADITTYIAAFTGLCFFESGFVTARAWPFIVMGSLWISAYLVSLLRFKHTPHLHLYSAKTAGYLQGIFMFTFFIWGNAEWYFWLMWTVSILAFAEELVVVSLIPQMRSNVKGIYWMIRERRAIA